MASFSNLSPLSIGGPQASPPFPPLCQSPAIEPLVEFADHTCSEAGPELAHNPSSVLKDIHTPLLTITHAQTLCPTSTYTRISSPTLDHQTPSPSPAHARLSSPTPHHARSPSPADGQSLCDDVLLGRSKQIRPTEKRFSQNPTGLAFEIVSRVIEEVYARVVRSREAELEKYKAWSDAVYGELAPDFVETIIHITTLTSHKLLMDLGSGIGNVVIHAALRTGCTAFGIEKVEVRADMAEQQLEEVETMIEVKQGVMGKVELVRGDILTHARVPELLGQADVVLVNNLAFDESCKCFSIFPCSQCSQGYHN